MTQTLIIHGWSDSSSSFEHVQQFLADRNLGPVEQIYFGDYYSREDQLTFYDVADGLHTEMVDKGFVNTDGQADSSLNVIVHSTGGLVIRHWIWRYFLKGENRIENCPIDRLIMLAPANFGSPLAHRGKSFLGSLLKGQWDLDDFLEVGKQLLSGLELASPYQWWLANRDLIEPQAPYRPDQIQTTVLVGTEGYEEPVSSLTGRPGTDGTVVISGTPLDALKVTMNCCPPKFHSDPGGPVNWNVHSSNVEIAFGVVPDRNHSTIVRQIGEGGATDELLLQALKTNDETTFRAHREACRKQTESTFESTEATRYQQFHVHAVDDQNQPVTDFSLEFRILKVSKIENHVTRNVPRASVENEFTADLHELMTRNVHTHSRKPSHRRFLVNLDDVRQLIKQARDDIGEEIGVALCIHIPEVDEGIHYDTDSLQNIVIHRTDRDVRDRPSFFYPNTTTLVKLRVNRQTKLVRITQEPKSN